MLSFVWVDYMISNRVSYIAIIHEFDAYKGVGKRKPQCLQLIKRNIDNKVRLSTRQIHNKVLKVCIIRNVMYIHNRSCVLCVIIIIIV